ncbi:MAG: bifunctional helix-turn-helix transcriptional regulator/GNAT family N-acetyltransferase [Flammeovirgaceae bacterium]
MNNFYNTLGKMALGSRLRRLSERLSEQAYKTYELYDIQIEPRWFPVLHVLAQGKAMTVTEIAEIIGHSHPSVSQMVRGMSKAGYIQSSKDKKDGRKTFLTLSEEGKALIAPMRTACQDVEKSVNEMLKQTHHDLWEGLNELEYLLEQEDLFHRVKRFKKARECEEVIIMDCPPEHYQTFSTLNYEWIEQYFTVEEGDRLALDHPKKYIIDKGGYILVADYHGKIVGVCALVKMSEERYELSKMAVSPEVQGKGIGWKLGNAIKEKAKSLGAKYVYLESNTKLIPALKLYQKLGFKKVKGEPSPYARANIQMEVTL